IFRSTEVTCGKEAPRSIKSVAFMTTGPSWVNIQHVSSAAASANVRVQRYRRAANQQLADGTKAPQPDPALTLRTDPSLTKWSVDDVIEASGKLPVEAMQAALTEVRHPFELNKKSLVALDDGGVSEPIIDLMVALTYPRRFIVERQGGGSAPAGISTGMGWFDPFMSPILTSGLSDCYSPMGFGYRSYYSMCGMGYSSYMYGYTSPYLTYYPYGYYGGWVDVGSAPQVIGSITDAQPQGDGRAINGRGYTQIRTRDAEPSPRINAGSNGGSWSGATSTSGATSSGYSSGSSGGSSGGSSAGDSGARVAVPKGGGQ
ncbi:MAG: hypothetical protein ACKOEC_05120, partial [Acidimicrobiia bacterium]